MCGVTLAQTDTHKGRTGVMVCLWVSGKIGFGGGGGGGGGQQGPNKLIEPCCPY